MIATTSEQAEARLRFRQSLGLPVLEEELRALAPDVPGKRIKALLKEMARQKRPA